MKINKENIESYIPQRTPFIMIDNLIAANSKEFETDFQVLPDNIFLDEDVLSEFALIENIAQSGAIGLTIVRRTSKEKPMDGYMGSISKLNLYDLPKVYDTIHTIVTLIAQLENMFLLKGKCDVNGRKLLECEIKLFGI